MRHTPRPENGRVAGCHRSQPLQTGFFRVTSLAWPCRKLARKIMLPLTAQYRIEKMYTVLKVQVLYIKRGTESSKEKMELGQLRKTWKRVSSISSMQKGQGADAAQSKWWTKVASGQNPMQQPPLEVACSLDAGQLVYNVPGWVGFLWCCCH